MRITSSRSSFSFARTSPAALCLLLACSGACSSKPTPAPDKEPPPAVVASASSAAASAAGSTSAATNTGSPVQEIPTFAPVRFAPKGATRESPSPRKVFAVEGAIMVASDTRVGRIVGEGVEWVGTVPGNPTLGGSTVDSVHGRWPDGIDMLYSSNNGRAPAPTFFAMTGKGTEFTVAPGGGLGYIIGVARVDQSTLVAGWSGERGTEIQTVRGPQLVRKQLSPEQGGCKEGEVRKSDTGPAATAIVPAAFQASPAGTLVAIGPLCEKRSAGAEIWDKVDKSRIVDLTGWIKKLDYHPQLLRGSGDELWLFAGGKEPLLHYLNGELSPAPRLDRPIRNIFVSPTGKLHAYDGWTIHRFDDGAWTAIAHLDWPYTFGAMVMDQELIWVESGYSVSWLRKSPSMVLQDGCETPFVYLYEVGRDNPKNFTFPSTRKALSTFADAADLGLVEFDAADGKRLGIKVTSKAQGEAVIAHLKETMKDEHPRLLCYAPIDPRRIELAAKGK